MTAMNKSSVHEDINCNKARWLKHGVRMHKVSLAHARCIWSKTEDDRAQDKNEGWQSMLLKSWQTFARLLPK